MSPAPLPANEAQRVARLQQLAVLDSAPEPLFDHLTRLAAEICGTPIALISLVDSERQWFKANVGLPGVTQSSRDVAFCAHAIVDGQLLEVNDATADPRFANNPLVLGDPCIRFYAGAPITIDDHLHIGTVCAIDRRPRMLDERQRGQLRDLATAVAHALQQRAQIIERAAAVHHAYESELEQRAEELAKALSALHASEALFRSLAESSPIGIFHTDPQGHCTYTNSRWQEIFGTTAEAAMGSGWSRTLHPEDRESVFQTWYRTAELGGEFEMDFRTLHDDGQVRHVRSRARAIEDEQGTNSGWVGTVADITLRIEAIRRLRASEAFLDRTGRLAGVGGWEVDLRTQRIDFSDQTCRIHDLPPGHKPTMEEALNFYAPEARPVIDAAIKRAIREGTPWDLELPFVTAKGRALWVRAVGDVERENGQPARLIGAFQDITERRQRLQQLRHEQDLRLQIETKAAELDRMLAERSRMLDVLAHEVRQPLNNASAALQSAESTVAALAPGEDSQAVQRLHRAQKVMGEVMASIDNTLAAAALLARSEAIERDDVDIDTLVAMAIADMPVADRPRITVERATSTRTASMDMSLMRLALRNLLANSLKYSPPAAPVIVRISDSDDPLALVIDVIDAGQGFDAALLPRLFQRGARGEKRRHQPGHGLGLYIVRRVMELHDGRVELLDNSEQGSTMRLLIGQAE